MNLGKLNRQIDIEKYSETRTDSGSVVKSWEKIGTIWAAVKYVSGGENTEAQQLQGLQSVEFTIRFCNLISANEMQRIKYKDEIFNIEFVNETVLGKILVIKATKKTINQQQ